MNLVTKLALFSLVASAPAARALEPKEEVEVTAGAVTSLSCALAAQKTGDLSLLTACPLAETKTGLVIFDVAEKQIYMTSKKKLAQHELESAYGGGSIDFVAVVRKVDKAGVALVDVSEYSVTKKKKPGSFKGCL
jgi:hypothetical protein